MPYPTRRVKKMLTAPDGMFINAALFGSYPKFLIRVAEYVVTTPLETESYCWKPRCKQGLSQQDKVKTRGLITYKNNGEKHKI
jgi:hypothetical protein